MSSGFFLYKMWWRLFLVQFCIQVSTAELLLPTVHPSVDGKSLILVNETRLDIAGFGEFDFQIADAMLEINSTFAQRTNARNTTKGKSTSAQQVQCPTIFNDFVLSYFAVELSDSDFFRLFELPPFLQSRFSGGPGNAVVREYIKASFNGLGWTVEEDTSVQSTPLGFIQFTSVIATFNPQYPKRLVLACHFDSKFTPSGFVGAIDAAVPCAMLLHLARKLNAFFTWAAAPVAIQMIFFDGEEPYVNFSPTDSLYGSRHLSFIWANTVDPLDNQKTKLGNIDYFILLDVIGHAETQFERFYPETDDLYTQLFTLEICLALKNLGTRSLPLTRTMFANTRRNFEIYDDQVPFRQQGVSKLMHLVTYPFPGEWHTLQDTANILDYKVIEDLNRILRVFVGNYFASQSFGLIYEQ